VCGANSKNYPEASALRISSLDPLITRQARMGQGLREVYDSVTESPLPSQLEMLLSELDNSSAPRRAI